MSGEINKESFEVESSCIDKESCIGIDIILANLIVFQPNQTKQTFGIELVENRV